MSQNDLARFGVALKTYVATLPRELGKAVLLETSDNFRRQGYENDAGAVVLWGPRKAADRRKGRANLRQRALLVQSGRLRRSVRIVITTASSVTVSTDVPYVEAQQEGVGGISVRPFIGLGRSVQQKLLMKISDGITALLE